MSRYELESVDPQYDAVIVGWDPGLNTFFVQASSANNGNEDDDGIALWLGTVHEEIPTVEDLGNRLMGISIEPIAWRLREEYQRSDPHRGTRQHNAVRRLVWSA